MEPLGTTDFSYNNSQDMALLHQLLKCIVMVWMHASYTPLAHTRCEPTEGKTWIRVTFCLSEP